MTEHWPQTYLDAAVTLSNAARYLETHGRLFDFDSLNLLQQKYEDVWDAWTAGLELS